MFISDKWGLISDKWGLISDKWGVNPALTSDFMSIINVTYGKNNRRGY